MDWSLPNAIFSNDFRRENVCCWLSVSSSTTQSPLADHFAFVFVDVLCAHVFSFFFLFVRLSLFISIKTNYTRNHFWNACDSYCYWLEHPLSQRNIELIFPKRPEFTLAFAWPIRNECGIWFIAGILNKNSRKKNIELIYSRFHQRV